MRAVVQRVRSAAVRVDGETVGRIDRGAVVLLGVSRTDTKKDADYLVRKLTALRMFSDEAGRMNLSAGDVGGGWLVVSQFTLYGDCRKGRRPSFDQAASVETARELYEYFLKALRARTPRVASGVFQAMMDVELINDGPVTFLLESEAVKA